MHLMLFHSSYIIYRKTKRKGTMEMLLFLLLNCSIALCTALPTSSKKRSFEDVVANLEEYSIDNLIDGFRRHQLYMSNTLLNTSMGLGVPQKLAEAQVEEAEERRFKAYRAKNEARTPFIATSSLLNLGYIGRGYDLFYGNPLSDDGIVDPGFRLPVIDLPFSFRFTSDGSYRIPDNVDVIAETSASFGSSYFQVQTESDYKSMLNVDASVNAHAGGWGFSGSFSASTSYKKSQQELQKGEKTTLSTIGRAIVYRARMSETAEVSKVSDYFESAIKALPVDHCEDENMQDLYLQVIEEFGTHYTTEVVMGAKAVQQVVFRTSDLDRMAAEGISASVAAKVSYSGFGANAGVGVDVGFGSSKEQRERIAKTEKEQKEYYIGGKPPSGDTSTGTTETLREWARSAAENPAPIQYKLSSIDSLLRPEFFKDLSYGLYERRQCLRRALFRYCTQTIATELCSQQSTVNTRRRRKRSTTQIDNARVVKYGDFVKIRNDDKFLVLSKDSGMAPGYAVKILISANMIQKYDGLFQLKPLDDDNRKAGEVLHYGDPFQLQSVEGATFFMGRTLLTNSKYASEAEIMDLFEDIDDKILKSNREYITSDYSIFLRQDNIRTYLVSLNISCHVAQVPRYQIDIHGTEGSITFNTIFPCKCSGRFGTYCFTQWYHRLIVDADIKTMQSVYIMGMNGYTTERVKGLQIRTTIKGRKEKYIISNPGCRNSKCSFAISGRPEAKQTAIDMFPVYFTFHSSDNDKNEGTEVTDRVTGYINIVSSMPKETYWGNPTNQLVALDDNGRINVRNKAPEGHKIVSTECNELIYPSSFAQYHQITNGAVISFMVPVILKYVKIDAESKDMSSGISMEYIDTDHKEFNGISSNISVTYFDSTSTNITLKEDLKCKAIKITSSQNVRENNLSVGGCPRAIIHKEKDDNTFIQWSLEVSENAIKTYPFLQMVPNFYDHVDIEKLFADNERSITLPLTTIIAIPSPIVSCKFASDYFQDFLTKSSDTSMMKFTNIQLRRETNRDGYPALLISMSITAVNEDEFDVGVLHVNQTLEQAIALFSCESETPKPTSASRVSGGYQSPITITSIGIISTLSVIILLVVVSGLLVFCRQGKCTRTKGKMHRDNSFGHVDNQLYDLRTGN